MYKNCSTEEATLRQREIEACLLEWMEKQSYNQISVKDLCDQAGICRRTFYRYFSSKDDCLSGLIDHTLMDFETFCGQSSTRPHNLIEEFEALLNFWRQQEHLLNALCKNDMAAWLIIRSILHTIEHESDFQRWLGNQHDDEKFESTQFIVSGVMGLIIGWHCSGYQKSTRQMAAIMNQLLLKPPLQSPDQNSQS